MRQARSPLHALAQQTRAISPRALDQRLHLDNPAEELLPWIEQCNALMARVARAYAQLESLPRRPTPPLTCACWCSTTGPRSTRSTCRFYRGQECRSCDDGQPHHGLGLAIVAAIARMNAGAPLAESVGGTTRIGFTPAAA
ncbi:MAG: hypothetical protein HS128_02315 [Ideonella sp.]|nr:hypothetical protein [Ideonella sp.]MCC7458576.1 hypothetical protein [Nitrospira sp.]